MKNRLMAVIALVGVACSREEPEAQPLEGYAWPATASWRMDYVSQTSRQAVPLAHYAETKTLRLVTRETGEHVLIYDSILRTSQDPEGVRVVPLTLEDTLAISTRLGERGEIGALQAACDRALPECAGARTSTVLLDLRRISPRLGADWRLSGTAWEDTVEYSDATARGTRNSVITAYNTLGDTTIAGVKYVVLSWRALHRTFRSGRAGALVAESPVQETGMTFIDPLRGLPVYSAWAGAIAAPPALRAAGATGTGFRGRAYLSGTVFDSLYSREVMP